MSNTTDRTLHERPRDPSPSGAEGTNDQGGTLVDASARTVASSLSALAFWSAIALPVLYFPLLVTGLSGVADLLAFFGLFGLHLVALFAGRSHRRDR